MIRAAWKPVSLPFRFEARTSRAVMRTKETYVVQVWDEDKPSCRGTGECALFLGLSREDGPDYERVIADFCSAPTQEGIENLPSSAKFGFESAFADLANGGRGIYFPKSRWVKGEGALPINGLIWMGDRQTMYDRIKEKLSEDFRCLKLKIGGIDFDEETSLLAYVRSRFSPETLELRLDANGSFTPDNALARLESLSRYGIHSIEQPIGAGQFDEMARICAQSPIPVALDEELIGDTSVDFKQQLLNYVRPSYIILKPSLCGGFKAADEWIDTAEKHGIGWWATSALESNIGLSAIAQWVAAKDVAMCQGLGTGELYEWNFVDRIVRRGSQLFYNPLAERIVPEL